MTCIQNQCDSTTPQLLIYICTLWVTQNSADNLVWYLSDRLLPINKYIACVADSEGEGKQQKTTPGYS